MPPNRSITGLKTTVHQLVYIYKTMTNCSVEPRWDLKSVLKNHSQRAPNTLIKNMKVACLIRDHLSKRAAHHILTTYHRNETPYNRNSPVKSIFLRLRPLKAMITYLPITIPRFKRSDHRWIKDLSSPRYRTISHLTMQAYKSSAALANWSIKKIIINISSRGKKVSTLIISMPGHRRQL